MPSSRKVGGGALILGGVTLLLGNMMHPRGPEGTMADLATLMASNLSQWYVSHTLLVISFPLWLLGFLALYQILDGKKEGSLALPAIVTLGVSLILLIIAVISDAYLAPVLAQNLVGASGDAAVPAKIMFEFEAMLVVTLLAPGFFMLFGGGGLLGASLVKAKLYNKWLGYAGIILALIGIVGYLLGVFGPYWVLSKAFIPYSIIYTVWVLVVGIFVYRGK